MNKPTAQELWERIALEISKIALCSGAPHPCADILQIINSYAQAYHEEHTQGTIIDIGGQRYNAVLTPYNPSPSSPHTKRT